MTSLQGEEEHKRRVIPQHRNMVVMREPKKMSRKSIKDKENVELPPHTHTHTLDWPFLRLFILSGQEFYLWGSV